MSNQYKNSNLDHNDYEIFHYPNNPSDKLAHEQARFKAAHKGHEGMHTMIFLIFFGSLFASPIIIKYWRRKSYRSFQIVNILLMCIMGQDLVDICIDRISISLGYYTIAGLPSKHLPKDLCAICGCSFAPNIPSYNGMLSEKAASGSNDTEKINDTVYTLNCDHSFHNGCIRGWCLIGKRDICPYW
ncbi:RING finger protein [Smittium culicis]|nr:RING finger protein [Smittium culicis]